jgi:hypothetical protein
MILYAAQDPGPKIYIKLFLKKTKYKKKEIKNFLELKKINKKKIDFAISGSSLGNSLDKKIIRWAKKNNILSISVIEHWTLFRKRFLLKKKYYYPDFILVNDNIAKQLAIADGIPREKIIISGNLILKKVLERKKKIKILKNKNILFISEPISEEYSKAMLSLYGYDEFKTLEYIIKNKPNDFKITIKIHPKENINKYSKFKSLVRIIRNKNLNIMSKNYYYIIGMTSMLLIELGIIRNDIISFRPNSKIKFFACKVGLAQNVTSEITLKKYFKVKPKNDNKKFLNEIKSAFVKTDSLLNLIKKKYKEKTCS